jgi:integrase
VVQCGVPQRSLGGVWRQGGLAQPATSAPFAGYHGGSREGGKRDIVAIHPETAQRLRRQLYSDRVDWVLQKFSKQLKLEHGYSAHSMRATFITTTLENDAKSEDVQRTVGHADPSTTQLYDRRRFTPTKSAALMVKYCTDRVISAMGRG